MRYFGSIYSYILSNQNHPNGLVSEVLSYYLIALHDNDFFFDSMKFIGRISLLLIILVGYTYENESDPYEDREHSLTRPYPSGNDSMLKKKSLNLFL